MRRTPSTEAPLSPYMLQPPMTAALAVGTPAQQQEAQQLAQAWLQVVAMKPAAVANVRAALGAGAVQAAAVGSDMQAVQQHLVEALVRAIIETQVGALANTAAVWTVPESGTPFLFATRTAKVHGCLQRDKFAMRHD